MRILVDWRDPTIYPMLYEQLNKLADEVENSTSLTDSDGIGLLRTYTALFICCEDGKLMFRTKRDASRQIARFVRENRPLLDSIIDHCLNGNGQVQ